MARKIKTYSSIWKVEKVLYKIEDWVLPRPVSFTQAKWFISILLITLIFGKYPPLSLIDNVIIRNLGIPLAGAFFFSKRTFDSKSAYSFFLSMVRFYFVNKESSRGRGKFLRTRKGDELLITIVKGVSL